MMQGETSVKSGLEYAKFRVTSGACVGGGLFIMSDSEMLWQSDWQKHVKAMGYFGDLERAIEEFIREFAVPQKIDQFYVIHDNISYCVSFKIISLAEYLDEQAHEKCEILKKEQDNPLGVWHYLGMTKEEYYKKRESLKGSSLANCCMKCGKPVKGGTGYVLCQGHTNAYHRWQNLRGSGNFT
jgi:hypothetical protein